MNGHSWSDSRDLTAKMKRHLGEEKIEGRKRGTRRRQKKRRMMQIDPSCRANREEKHNSRSREVVGPYRSDSGNRGCGKYHVEKKTGRRRVGESRSGESGE